MAGRKKPYRTFDFLCCDDGGIIYNASKWKINEAIKDYEFNDKSADVIEEVYYRYLCKDEIDDWEIMMDYEDGIYHFTECSKDDNRAIKGWLIKCQGKHLL